MLSFLSYAAPFALVASVSVLPGGPAIRHAAAGTVFVSLAVAAGLTATAAPSSFHTINNALLWCGLGLGFVALATAWRSGHRAACLPLAAALVLVTAGGGGMLREGRVLASMLAGIAGAAALSMLPIATVPVGGKPMLPVVPAAIRRWMVALILASLLLPSIWFVFTVAGPEGRSLQGLREAPFSPAGEVLLAALLLPASLVVAGAWPFGFLVRGPRLAPLGALLVLVVVLPLAGDGMEHWRSIYAGWLLLGALIAAATARWPDLMASAGLFVISVAGGDFGWAGASLTIIASLVSLAPPAHDLPRRVVLLLAAGFGVVALRASLGVEVVYSTGMALAVLIAILRTPYPATRST